METLEQWVKSKLTKKVTEQCHRCRSGVFIADFEQVCHIFVTFDVQQLAEN